MFNNIKIIKTYELLCSKHYYHNNSITYNLL